MEKEKSKTLVTTGKCRFSYANLTKAVAIQGRGEPKFSVCLLIPKSDKASIKKIQDAIDAAVEQGLANIKDWPGRTSQKFWNPLQDGDRDKPGKPEYKGMMFVNAKSGTRPNIVDKEKQEILDTTEIYSGMWGRASISFFPYSQSGGIGVGAGLNNVQKLADDKPFTGRSSPDEDFADDWEDEDDI